MPYYCDEEVYLYRPKLKTIHYVILTILLVFTLSLFITWISFKGAYINADKIGEFSKYERDYLSRIDFDDSHMKFYNDNNIDNFINVIDSCVRNYKHYRFDSIDHSIKSFINDYDLWYSHNGDKLKKTMPYKNALLNEKIDELRVISKL